MGRTLKKRICNNNYAVSDIVAIIFVLMIATGTISAVLYWSIPTINDKKAYNRSDSVVMQLGMLSDVLEDGVIEQGFNSSKNIKLTADAGQILLDPDGSRLVIYYSLDENFDFHVNGFDDTNEKEFSITIEKGSADSLTINYLNDDDSEDLNIPPPESSDPITDQIRIDIKNIGGEVIGRIWLFDLGSINYETQSSQSNYKVKAENGGTIFQMNNNAIVENKPNIYFKNNFLFMNIIQINTTGGGVFWDTSNTLGGNYRSLYLKDIHVDAPTIRFNTKLNSTKICESKASINKINLQIIADKVTKEAYESYFKLYLNFEKYESGNGEGTLYFNQGSDFDFILIQSICDIEASIT